MNEPITERDELWDKFLSLWPIEKLANMSLEQYTQADSKETLTYWMEFGTQILGSMRGGGSFKFGIYCRKGPLKEKREHFKHDDVYSWYGKYGETREQAFVKIKSLIVECANAAQQGDLESIDSIDLGDVYKWKLAFLYQNRQKPSLLPIYKAEHLQAAVGPTSKGLRYPALFRKLIAGKNNESLFTYADAMWEKASLVLSEKLTPEEALTYFSSQTDRFIPIKPPTNYIAGFSLIPSGQQIALVRDNKETTLFLSPGEWVNIVRNQLGKIQEYESNKSRNSNLLANAPDLAEGKPAVMVRVPTKAALISLCDAYDDTEYSESKPMNSNNSKNNLPNVPLNQIFYGPPGTGKTYATIEAALEVLDAAFLIQHKENRAALKERFDTLASAGHVRFVTFHQSFSYEDFVEGLRAENGEDGKLRYEVVDGVFKNLCSTASARVTQQAEAPVDLIGRKIWKMSLGNSLGSDAYIYDECIENGYALLGYGHTIDFSGCKDREDVFQKFEKSGELVAKDSYAVTAVSTFLLKIRPGDLIVVSEGNSKFRAIGEVTGEYECINRDESGDYGQCRKVTWLRAYKPSLPLDQLMFNQFSQMTLYELKPSAIDMDKLAQLLDTGTPSAKSGVAALFKLGERFGGGYVVRHTSSEILELEKPNGKHLPLGMSLLETLAGYVRSGKLTIDDIREKRVFEIIQDSSLEPYLVNGYSNVLPYLVERICGSSITRNTTNEADENLISAKVLIIDEINRGNVSRIFGELITLIEPSKRKGMDEALEVTLPYSKDRFSVPSNVYLIGTMNTADRSLAGLDIALRRRFHFKEMPPIYKTLDNVFIEDICVGEMLKTMNDRIEALLDRDHCLGHTYFLPLQNEASLSHLALIFRQQILPLLQEYFFEDWERIRWVLNDHQKLEVHQFIVPGISSAADLFGHDAPGLGNVNSQWKLGNDAFELIESFRGIIRT